MTPDGYDDVRVLLRELDPGPLPDLDVDAIVRGGELERRRRARSRWYAVAAVLVVVAAVGAGLLTLARPEAVGPAAPGGSSSPTPGTSSFRPTPYTPQQWLLYAQTDIDTASSVHVRELLEPDYSSGSIDAVLGATSAIGTITFQGVTSRFVSINGADYVQPAVPIKAGLMTQAQAGGASWVRLSEPYDSRFRIPQGVRSVIGTADASRWSATFGTPRVVDGTPTTAIDTDIRQLQADGEVMTFYLTAEPPYLPLLVVRDGKEIQRFSDWNAPIATPVAPPASEVTTVPGL
jgi:hypothetical protein